jgi:PAS domain S-box-containing protein
MTANNALTVAAFGEVHRFELLVTSVRDYAIYILDPRGTIVSWNAGAQRFKGYLAEEVIGQNFSLFYTDEARQAGIPVRALRMAAEAGKFEDEGWRVRKDGTRFWAHVVIDPIRNDVGQLIGYAKITRDITERKVAQERERRNRELQVELAHANRAATMSQLTASIAHEIQQPICATAAYASAALRWLDSNPANLGEVRQALERIASDAMRAGGVVGRIRDLINKPPSRKDNVDINEAVGEVIELMRSEAAKNDVSILTVFGVGLPFVVGDRVQLQQVVLNLIVNAIEAISATSAGPREVLICTAADLSSGVYVAVRDSGHGLPSVDAERVFDPLYTTKDHGLGMSLSICCSIVEAHGGRLSACANAPRGAVFQFVLPSVEVEQGSFSKSEDLPRVQAPRLR